MFHTYEDQIAAAKKQFNNSQMSHVLDEAREIGEKIAEEAEKTAPKTPEERKDDMIEEATGKDEEGEGMLSEMMDEMAETVEELEEQLEEELGEQLEEQLEEQPVENLPEAEEMQEMTITEKAELEDEKLFGQTAGTAAQQIARQVRTFQAEQIPYYKHIDYRM